MSDIIKRIRKWFYNYWYHYKWPVIIALVFIIIFAIGFGQIAFEKNSYDVYALYGGSVYLENEAHLQIENIMQEAAAKVSGEPKDKQDINLQMLIYLTEEVIKEREAAYEAMGEKYTYDPFENARVYDTFSKQLISGENVIMFLDPEMYKDAEGHQVLYPIKDILGREFPGMTESGLGMKLYECGLTEKYPIFESLPENTIVCFRRVPHAMQLIGRKESQDIHKFQLDVAREMFSGIE